MHLESFLTERDYTGALTLLEVCASQLNHHKKIFYLINLNWLMVGSVRYDSWSNAFEQWSVASILLLQVGRVQAGTSRVRKIANDRFEVQVKQRRCNLSRTIDYVHCGLWLLVRRIRTSRRRHSKTNIGQQQRRTDRTSKTFATTLGRTIGQRRTTKESARITEGRGAGSIKFGRSPLVTSSSPGCNRHIQKVFARTARSERLVGISGAVLFQTRLLRCVSRSFGRLPGPLWRRFVNSNQFEVSKISRDWTRFI